MHGARDASWFVRARFRRILYSNRNALERTHGTRPDLTIGQTVKEFFNGKEWKPVNVLPFDKLPGSATQLSAATNTATKVLAIKHFHPFYDGTYIKQNDGRYVRADKPNHSLTIAEEKIQIKLGRNIFMDIKQNGRIEEWSHLTQRKWAETTMPEYAALRSMKSDEIHLYGADGVYTETIGEDGEKTFERKEVPEKQFKVKPSFLWLWFVLGWWIWDQPIPSEHTAPNTVLRKIGL